MSERKDQDPRQLLSCCSKVAAIPSRVDVVAEKAAGNSIKLSYGLGLKTSNRVRLVCSRAHVVGVGMHLPKMGTAGMCALS